MAGGLSSFVNSLRTHVPPGSRTNQSGLSGRRRIAARVGGGTPQLKSPSIFAPTGRLRGSVRRIYSLNASTASGSLPSCHNAKLSKRPNSSMQKSMVALASSSERVSMLSEIKISRCPHCSSSQARFRRSAPAFSSDKRIESDMNRKFTPCAWSLSSHCAGVCSQF